ncbi:MAG: radical SAM protein, partial [Eggerthellaceae bacterium]|nr:radical SAM protein [Eggerthellaceae bacterium]
MSITTKQEVLEVLEMDNDEFFATIAPQAKKVYQEQDGRIIVRSMLGYSNRCKNRCLYCGMRAPNKEVKRYWTPVEDIIAYARKAHDHGFTRIFLVSGEDRKYSVDDICHYIHEIHEMGMHITVAAGWFPKSAYQEMKDAGLDQYMIKFEMAQPEMFNRLNPSTNFEERMGAIEAVKDVGLQLASGNIIDYP